MEIDLKQYVRNIPDFPKVGIVFRDITTILKEPIALTYVVDQLVNKYKNENIDKIVAIESRGFIFGGILAKELNVGFVPIRKPGKLPAATLKEEYQLEYGVDAIEIHKDAINSGENILIHDDLLATGGTMKAACNVIEKLGGNIVGISFIIELLFLDGRKLLKDYDVNSLIVYEDE